MGQSVPPLNEHLFNDISGYLLAKDQLKAARNTCYMDFKLKPSKRLLLSAGQSITSETTGTVGGTDQPHVEIEEAGIDEEDGAG